MEWIKAIDGDDKTQCTYSLVVLGYIKQCLSMLPINVPLFNVILTKRRIERGFKTMYSYYREYNVQCFNKAYKTV